LFNQRLTKYLLSNKDFCFEICVQIKWAKHSCIEVCAPIMKINEMKKKV
jgi:hypothetical protein